VEMKVKEAVFSMSFSFYVCSFTLQVTRPKISQ